MRSYAREQHQAGECGAPISTTHAASIEELVSLRSDEPESARDSRDGRDGRDGLHDNVETKTLAERCQSPGVSDGSLLRSSTFFRSIIESAGLGRSVLHGQMGNVPNDPGSFSAEPWWGSIQCASVAALASIRAQPSPALSFVPRAACQAYTGRT